MRIIKELTVEFSMFCLIGDVGNKAIFYWLCYFLIFILFRCSNSYKESAINEHYQFVYVQSSLLKIICLLKWLS